MSGLSNSTIKLSSTLSFYVKFIEWQKTLIQEFIENLTNPDKADKSKLNDKKDNAKKKSSKQQ